MKLQPLLTEYLIENKILPLQDVGYLTFKTGKVALPDEDFTLFPPQVSLEFISEKPSPIEHKKLVDYISQRLSITEQQATELLSKEGSLQIAFAEKGSIDWAPLGGFQTQKNGTISFESANVLQHYLPAIVLQKNKPEPMTEVPVENANSAEPVPEPMYELAEPERKDYWWLWAIVILVVSVILILFRYL